MTDKYEHATMQTNSDDINPMNEHTDELIDVAYQQRKKQNQAPRKLRSHVLAVAAKKENKSTRYSLQWPLAAAVLSIAVLSLVYMQISISPSDTQRHHPTLLTLHTVTSQPEQGYSKQVEYNDLLVSFQEKERIYAVTEIPARLASIDDGLAMETCDSQNLLITEELATLMAKNAMLPSDLNVGDQVMLALSARGQIVEILSVDKPLQC